MHRVSGLRDVLRATADRVADFREHAGDRSVAPSVDLAGLRAALGGPLPEGGTDPQAVIEQLANAAEPALTASIGPRYFGFVIGGSLDAAACADVLTTGWDQVAFNAVTSPVAAVVEEVAGQWLKEALGLPHNADPRLLMCGFQSGRTSYVWAHETERTKRGGRNGGARSFG